MGQVDGTNLEEVMTYHPATAEQAIKYIAVRDAAVAMGKVILEHVPQCADRTVALRKLRECRMDANAAIALNGLI
jgi:hypothetical protein